MGSASGCRWSFRPKTKQRRKKNTAARKELTASFGETGSARAKITKTAKRPACIQRANLFWNLPLPEADGRGSTAAAGWPLKSSAVLERLNGGLSSDSQRIAPQSTRKRPFA